MQKIEQDVYVTIEECGALAEVVIPFWELNDIRRERDEYLAQTASDLYDRVVYMVRSEDLEYEPPLSEGESPLVEITLRMDMFVVSSEFWRETRRERQDKLKDLINELFMVVMIMKKNYDDVVREEEEDAKKE
jgi:hypothetical protein